MAHVAGQCGEPAPAHQPARVAHRVHAAHAVPVGERRPGDDDGAEQLGTGRRGHHHLPASLAVADHDRLALRLRMQLDHPLKERGLGLHHVLDGLAGDRIGQEAHEVAGMAGAHGHADLAVGLESADPGPVPGAGVDDHERPLLRIDRDAARRGDPDHAVIHRPGQRRPAEHELAAEAQDMGRPLRHVLVKLVAALTHHVEVEDTSLPSIDPVVDGIGPQGPRRTSGSAQVGLRHQRRSSKGRKRGRCLGLQGQTGLYRYGRLWTIRPGAGRQVKRQARDHVSGGRWGSRIDPHQRPSPVKSSSP